MIRLLALAVLLWALGFVLFVVWIPRDRPTGRVDGVVVLTGGPGRIQRGLALVRSGVARRMLVSGAAPGVRPHELAREAHVPDAVFDRVDLGKDAIDTRSNADETAAWVRRHGYRSIRLVTTDWHMARARLELGHVLPSSVRVEPDPVPSTPDLTGLVREYNKYLLRRAAIALGR